MSDPKPLEELTREELIERCQRLAAMLAHPSRMGVGELRRQAAERALDEGAHV